MRCLGWRYSYNNGKWSSVYSCQERWRSCHSLRTWVQVWEGEVWVMRENSYYTREDE